MFHLGWQHPLESLCGISALKIMKPGILSLSLKPTTETERAASRPGASASVVGAAQ